MSNLASQRRRDKHPEGLDADTDFLDDSPETIEHHSSLFERIDSKTIRRAALRTSGGQGPLGLDCISWAKVLTFDKLREITCNGR